MRIGIYGGTFSPVHKAHIRAAELFLSECKLDKLMIVPVGSPPHKKLDENDDPVHRLEMCRLAFSHIPNAEVSDMEIVREGISYTVITVRELEGNDRELLLLCGTDMLLTFERWYCFEEIMQKCTLVCIRREENENINKALTEKIGQYREMYNAKIIDLNVPAVEMSSTDVRNTLKSRENVTDMITDEVLEYIRKHGLYEK